MNDFSGGVSTGPAGAKVSHRLYTLSENIHCSQEEAAMTILDRIAQTVRERLEERKRRIPITCLQERAHYHSPTLPLARALRTDELAIIAEIKKASPSKGILRREFNVSDIAQQYKWYGAAAISVLTEPDFFQGSLEHLEAARRTVDLPLLRKDFILDPYQLIEARAYGADAVLLIAALLDPVQLHELYDMATELGLSCLVEVHAEAELDQLDLDRIEILGVNNRNLHNFEVDVTQAVRVLQRVPAHIVRVAESGLRTAEELAYLRRNGIDAVLIGETFMRALEPGRALEALRQELQACLERPVVLRLVGS
ncbi:indole-3-glycerol phosphate synthase TrpC [Rhodothermus bifroesti]|jgi:indole-3-glycerol phosphate synthase|nr:Indole-3-glycerol phosphate synthase [bacterium HR18]